MISTRNEIIAEAVDRCMKDLYSYAQPQISWDKFTEENKIYSNKYKAWERYNYLYHKKDKTKNELEEYSKYPTKWEGKNIIECIGPRPYEFYYLSKDKMKEICDHYIYLYRLCNSDELKNTIKILKDYCNNPIVDYYEEGEKGYPGHRSYKHPDNLNLEIQRIFVEKGLDYNEYELATKCVDKFFEFLDMADNFYNWNSEINAFNMSVYLGVSPNSNKKAVIKNWKIYRNQDIEINDITEEDDDF